jgi:hypothetical protein
MPLTTRLEIDDQTNGSNNNTWGDVTDDNLRILEQAIAGVTSIATTGGTTTLTSSQNRFPIIVITGTLVSNATINVRAAEKNWLFINSTSGAFTVTVKTPSGSGQVLGQGESRRYYCDGVNVLNAGSQIVSSGSFRVENAFASYQLFPTTGTANQRAFRIQADNGNLTFIGVDDSNNQQNFPFQIAWGGNATFTTSALIISPVSGIGYGTGAGGVVTQTTSKSTAVTLNTPSGVIIMNNQALAVGASVQFTFNNSVMLSTDVLLLTVTGNTFTGYRVEPVNILTGQAGIRVTNVTGSTLSDALTINFAILRCATS